MAHTYTQLYVQIVFAVKGRHALIDKSWQDELFKYISGIISNKKQKSIIVNGHIDHIHAFVGMKPNFTISDLVREMKNSSTEFINDNRFIKGKFLLQEGYGAFTYSQSQIDRVYKYILNQEAHHKKITFNDEYIGLLKKFEIPFEDRFLFEWVNL